MTVEEIKTKAYNDCLNGREPEELDDVAESFLYLQVYSVYKLHSVQAVSSNKAKQIMGMAILNYNKFRLHKEMYAEYRDSIPQHTICQNCGAIVYNKV